MIAFLSRLLLSMPLLSKIKILGFLKTLLAVMMFMAIAVIVDTFLSFSLPHIFAERKRKDIYEMPSLGIAVNLGKYSATFAVSVWAGIATAQWFLKRDLREGREGALVGVEEAENPFESQSPSTPTIDPVMKDWMIFDRYLANPDISDTATQAFVDNTSEWNPAIRDWYDSRN